MTLPEAGHPKGKVVETHNSPADQQADSEGQRDHWNSLGLSGRTALTFGKLKAQTSGADDNRSKQLDKRECVCIRQGFLLSPWQGDAAGAPLTAPREAGSNWRNRHQQCLNRSVLTIRLYFCLQSYPMQIKPFFQNCFATPTERRKKNNQKNKNKLALVTVSLLFQC